MLAGDTVYILSSRLQNIEPRIQTCTCALIKFLYVSQTAAHKLLDKHYPPDIYRSKASARSLSGSLLAQPWAEVEAHLSDAQNLSFTLRGLETACVDKEQIIEFVTTKQWKPKIDDGRLDWPRDNPNRLQKIFNGKYVF